VSGLTRLTLLSLPSTNVGVHDLPNLRALSALRCLELQSNGLTQLPRDLLAAQTALTYVAGERGGGLVCVAVWLDWMGALYPPCLPHTHARAHPYAYSVPCVMSRLVGWHPFIPSAYTSAYGLLCAVLCVPVCWVLLCDACSAT
jgi:hypothetical protein